MARHVHTWMHYDKAPGVFQVICRDCGIINTADDLALEQHEALDTRAALAASEAAREKAEAPAGDVQDIVRQLLTTGGPGSTVVANVLLRVTNERDAAISRAEKAEGTTAKALLECAA